MPKVTQEAADAIAVTVRNFFKNGHKASNKLYFAKDGSVDAASAKGAARSTNQALANTSIDASRAKTGGQTAIAIGKILWDSGKGDGNCWEQACMAAYWASFKGYENVWLGTISEPGDHVFCLIGAEGDMPHHSFKTAAEMGHSPMAAMVVDPWANTACPVAEYPAAFLKKMKKWTADNKRVSLASKAFSGWIEPSNPIYVKGFLEGPLRFENARTATRT